jgi:hypothetical protein
MLDRGVLLSVQQSDDRLALSVLNFRVCSDHGKEKVGRRAGRTDESPQQQNGSASYSSGFSLAEFAASLPSRFSCIL